MATREELAVIRDARAGFPAAQIELGKRYLDGSGGLPRSMETAWHWLKRAASKESIDACILIGRNIPYELVRNESNLPSVCSWYERAFDAGVTQAGLVLAKLMLTQSEPPVDASRQRKLFHALNTAANAGIAEAQWLLAQGLAEGKESGKVLALKWTTRAAMNGVQLAQYLLAEQAWAQGNHTVFLRWAQPLAQALRKSRGDAAQSTTTPSRTPPPLTDQQVKLLSNCAQILSKTPDANNDDILQYWLMAARQHDKEAQLLLGLWLAKIEEDGSRRPYGPSVPDFKRALHWLNLAARQGSSEAWYAMSKIYFKIGFAQRSVKEAQHCREQAADLGHRRAQFECGAAAWRARHQDKKNELRSVYWLQKAVGQGCVDSAALLAKIAVPAKPAQWAQSALVELSAKYLNENRFVAARIELSAWFGLSRPEALMIDLIEADKGFCLEVDLRAKHRCGKRRIILIETAQQRQALTRIAQISSEFSIEEPEAEQLIRNHLQCLYRVGRQHLLASEDVAPADTLKAPN